MRTLYYNSFDLIEIATQKNKSNLFCCVLKQMTFDYQYIDPGPDDPGCTRNRYFALNVSVYTHPAL